MILDYSTFLEDKYSDGIHGHTSPNDLNIFFRKQGWCPFCKVDIPRVHTREGPYNHIPGTPSHTLTEVWSCAKCGWWEIEHNHGDDWIFYRAIRRAILRSFQPSDAALPVEVLRIYLRNHPDILYKIHPTKMEQLVQSVFKDYFDCEVVHCGRSHDGGIDLILVSSEEPAVIQVKRRECPTAVEPVTTVRHLLGAMLLQQKQHGIIVTTADHFSPEAEASAAKAVTLDIVKSFDLIAANRFFAMLDLVRPQAKELWRPHML